MTHPFHPHLGRELELVECHGRGTGGERAYYNDGARLESIPVEWTDLGPEDPFVVASAGRAHFRVEDLLRLSALIEDLPVGSGRVRPVSGK